MFPFQEFSFVKRSVLMICRVQMLYMAHVLNLWRDGWLRFEAARVNATAKVAAFAPT